MQIQKKKKKEFLKYVQIHFANVNYLIWQNILCMIYFLEVDLAHQNLVDPNLLIISFSITFWCNGNKTE